jgi:hypothetical protein
MGGTGRHAQRFPPVANFRKKFGTVSYNFYLFGNFLIVFGSRYITCFLSLAGHAAVQYPVVSAFIKLTHTKIYFLV